MNKKITNRSRKSKERATEGESIIGTLSKHRKGFGFVIPEEEGSNDIFIGPNHMNNAMNGDKVAVKLLQPSESSRAREGIIHIVLERNTAEIVGTFENNKNFGFVISDDKKINDDIFVSKSNFNSAKTGDKVVLTVTKWPENGNKAEGRVSEIISKKGEPGGDIKALIRQYNLSKEFPQKVQMQAETVETSVKENEVVKRRDLREKTTITIDGATSKDFDDAVSLEMLKNGNYLLGVHIADVSHYVREGSPLDREALKRGNSVYLIDQVVPMLPERLSNGICSLNPNVDRLTLSIDMEVNGQGTVVAHEIYESVIKSKARMVYTDVSDILENEDEALISKYHTIYEELKNMDQLAKILRSVRDQRGSLDFDFDEAYITLNKKGIPTSIEAAERRVANKMIEEFMLLANETVAEHFFWMEIPFVYRVHEKPDVEKVEEFKKFIGEFGLNMKGNPENIHPKVFNEIIQMVQGKPEENIINTIMLRSMKKAFYDPACQGHFGLGVKYYCHFTSPIRRYSDLIVHRIIKETLQGKLSEKKLGNFEKKVLVASDTCSKTERLAQELEREVEKLKKAEYMSYHVGEEFDGIVSGVASFGFFVEIESTIEGMVRVESLKDDFYDFENTKYRLIGRRTNKIFRLGDQVKILVDSVDIQNREINFVLA